MPLFKVLRDMTVEFYPLKNDDNTGADTILITMATRLWVCTSGSNIAFNLF